MVILLVQTWVSVVERRISLVQGLMQNMSMTRIITSSNDHFTCSNMGFYYWKRYCTCPRSDAKHVHGNNYYLFKWSFYLFKHEFLLLKRELHLSRSDAKHVHDTNNYLFKRSFYLFKHGFLLLKKSLHLSKVWCKRCPWQ